MLTMLNKVVRTGILALGVTSLAGLSSCGAPRELLRPIQLAADRCGIAVGKNFADIKACLDSQGINLVKVKYPTKVETWWYRKSGRGDTPLTASVAWVLIEVDANGLISNWETKASLDGV